MAQYVYGERLWKAELLMNDSAPWYHYIPLKPDFSDLYDIMAFFVGPVDEEGNVDESKGHDVSDLRNMQLRSPSGWHNEKLYSLMNEIAANVTRRNSLGRLVKPDSTSRWNIGHGETCRHM